MSTNSVIEDTWLCLYQSTSHRNAKPLQFSQKRVTNVYAAETETISKFRNQPNTFLTVARAKQEESYTQLRVLQLYSNN